jgi:hypothetical protein
MKATSVTTKAETSHRRTLRMVLETASVARQAERDGDVGFRNTLAAYLFRHPSARRVSHAGLTVETWWLASDRSFVTQLKDTDDNQIGDADYSGNRTDAAVSHLWAIYKILDAAAKAASEPDRRPVWSFTVDGRHIRWCGTLEQWERDCLDYTGASTGTWTINSKHHRTFTDAGGYKSSMRAVKVQPPHRRPR